jgi:hypothetical protein
MTRLEESQSVRNTEIHVPDGFPSLNKCRWPLIAAAGADVGEGTAVRWGLVWEWPLRSPLSEGKSR